jgi:predicted amino acid racemase
MAHLNINLPLIRDNIEAVTAHCGSHGINVVGVVKPCQDFDPIVDVYNQSDLAGLGVSKIHAAKRLAGAIRKPLMLTCVPRPDLADEVVSYCDISLNSELDTITRLADASRRQKTRHSVLLMVEVGDLREGVLPEDVLPMVSRIRALEDSGIRFAGIGANYGCVNGVLPSFENMRLIEELARRIGADMGTPPDIVSLGGSVVLDWLDMHGLPPSVNQIRVGEPLLLGTLSGAQKVYNDLHSDALEFEAVIVELKSKPSFPAGAKTGDAFGIHHEPEDRGIRTRAILDFGVVDTDPKSLVSMVPGLSMITSNSDYTVVDITECNFPYHVGDRLKFKLTYKSMLQCFTSVQLQKNVRGCGAMADVCFACNGHKSRCGSQQLSMDFIGASSSDALRTEPVKERFPAHSQ